mmetsp:Transcript_4029/g.7398  ORF Transcript_4029/g.7398 Transcript_4029/m.7398 type:complete len:204 (+) Transcript_4029:173-784(+)
MVFLQDGFVRPYRIVILFSNSYPLVLLLFDLLRLFLYNVFNRKLEIANDLRRQVGCVDNFSKGCIRCIYVGIYSLDLLVEKKMFETNLLLNVLDGLGELGLDAVSLPLNFDEFLLQHFVLPLSIFYFRFESVDGLEGFSKFHLVLLVPFVLRPQVERQFSIHAKRQRQLLIGVGDGGDFLRELLFDLLHLRHLVFVRLDFVEV